MVHSVDYIRPCKCRSSLGRRVSRLQNTAYFARYGHHLLGDFAGPAPQVRSMATSNGYVIGRVDVEGRVGWALGDRQQS